MKKATFAGIAVVAFLLTFICFVSTAEADAVSFDLSGSLPSAAALGTMNFAFASAGRADGVLTLDNSVRGFDFWTSTSGANASFEGDTVLSPFRMGILDFWPRVPGWTSVDPQNDRTFHFGFFRRWSWSHGADPTPSPSPTPEPPALLLLGTGLLAIGIQMRRRSPVS
jgi:hypothetical protein